MKHLFSSLNISEVRLLRDLAEQEGIPCVIRNEHTSMAVGSIPFTDSQPELWIANEADYARASALIEMWQHGSGEAQEPWVCPRCGEVIEGQFGACWKCGFEEGGENNDETCEVGDE